MRAGHGKEAPPVDQVVGAARGIVAGCLKRLQGGPLPGGRKAWLFRLTLPLHSILLKTHLHLLKLTLWEHGRSILVNIRNVNYFDRQETYTRLYFKSGTSLTVRETYEQILCLKYGRKAPGNNARRP